MRICVTGSRGYVGSVLVPALRASGHSVAELDMGYFNDCLLEPAPVQSGPDLPPADLRSIGAGDLEDVEAVVHLAGLSNDALGEVDPSLTDQINAMGTRRLVACAREAGVSHLVLASSCSVYGNGGGCHELAEEATLFPLTSYARSKAAAESAVVAAATDAFRTTVLRGSTVYGASPRLRLDLVVNELTAMAITEGKVLLRSRGMSWRPFLHVSDFCSAFRAILEASPRELKHQVYNVGAHGENYQILEAGRIVAEMTNSDLVIAPGLESDARDYRVSFRRIRDDLPQWTPEWGLASGVEDLAGILLSANLTPEMVGGDRFRRLSRLQRLIAEGALTPDLRWRVSGRHYEPRSLR